MAAMLDTLQLPLIVLASGKLWRCSMLITIDPIDRAQLKVAIERVRTQAQKYRKYKGDVSTMLSSPSWAMTHTISRKAYLLSRHCTRITDEAIHIRSLLNDCLQRPRP
jgi:hypothetical protein